MELNSTNIKDLEYCVLQYDNNTNLELEARITTNQYTGLLDYYKFVRILNKLIFDKENGGMGYNYNITSTLDISIGNIRCTIDNIDNIKLMWLNNELDINKIKIMKKQNNKRINLTEYDLRINLSDEILIDDENEKKEIYNKIISRTVTKTYRQKNRYEIITDDNIFRYDFTILKMGKGYSYKNSKTLYKNEHFEIELECIKRDQSLYDKFIKNLNILVSLYQNTSNILKNTDKNKILNNYFDLIKLNNINNNFKGSIADDNYKRGFIAASPITLHINNLIKGDNNLCIQENYCVTPKADGLK